MHLQEWPSYHALIFVVWWGIQLDVLACEPQHNHQCSLVVSIQVPCHHRWRCRWMVEYQSWWYVVDEVLRCCMMVNRILRCIRMWFHIYFECIVSWDLLWWRVWWDKLFHYPPRPSWLGIVVVVQPWDLWCVSNNWICFGVVHTWSIMIRSCTSWLGSWRYFLSIAPNIIILVSRLFK